MQAVFGKWLWERTGLNILEQRRLPASIMRGYRLRFQAGLEAASVDKDGIQAVLARGW